MSGDAPPVWVLNLDADDELAHRGAHSPKAATVERIVALAPVLRALAPERLWPDPTGGGFAGRPGRAWCPTRWALERMELAGVRPPRAPTQDVLRRVNHRRFAHELGQALPGAAFVSDARELAEVLGAHGTLERASEQGAWLLKRPFGYAGRGRRKVGPTPAADDAAWIDASHRADGLMVEPLVTRLLDCALHGYVTEDGRCALGELTVQDVDATGAWVESRRAPPGTLSAAEWQTMVAEARRTAEALHQAGYLGPFGLDAFRWRAPDGAEHFQPRCELNARYSMGWRVGMGGFQPPEGAP